MPCGVGVPGKGLKIEDHVGKAMQRLRKPKSTACVVLSPNSTIYMYGDLSV